MNRFSKLNLGLSSKRRVLLETLLQQEGIEASYIPRISRRQDTDSLPLSSAQQRLWFLNQLEPGGTVYNISRAFDLIGSPNLAALERSLNEIVQRHEVLRTAFAMRDRRVVQVVSPFTGRIFSIIDLSELPQFEREVQTQQLAREEALRPFDLAHNPLVRVQLLRQSMEKHVLLLSIHHIVCDGWSLGILLRELSTLYQAFSTAQPSPLPALPLQYADYTLWQHQWLHSDSLLSQQAYWLQHLSNAPSVLQLPTDHPRPPLQSFQGAHHRFSLPLALSEDLKALSQREGATLFMTLLAAFSVLLLRYSGQEDILIGTPIANRQQSEIKDLIGNFANSLALRLDLSGAPGFSELLARVREICLGAYANQDLPFERLVETIEPERSLSHSPLFQIMFAFQNMPAEALQLSGLNVNPLAISETGTARMDLMLSVTESPHGLLADFEYSTELFEAATIGRMGDHLQQILAAIVADPQQRLGALPLLTEAERQHLLLDWNASRSAYPRDRCLHHWFEAQVARTPDAIALLSAQEYLTYHELNRRADLLATALHQRGVGPDVLVGLCLPRTPALLIALLAILKASAAYLPLDPTYPTERLAFMLADAQVPLVLTQSSCLPCLPARDHAHDHLYLCLDQLDLSHSQQPGALPCRALAEHLAYVIYTSGSTGQPKGVAIAHRNASALLDWAQTCFPAHLLGGVLASTSICFDLSLFELFLPWSSGGTVVLAQDALHLPTLPAAQAVTLLNTVPSVLSALLQTGPLPPSVRTVTLAGEALPASLLQRLHAHPGVQQVYNLYGPSEDTTYSTWALLSAPGADPVPIGRPISNTQCYVLDPHGQPVPLGVSGELFLGGAGLARGYLGQPGLTAERFVPHPWSSEPGARLYRTGDLVRHLPDGSLTFVGRVDSQVKLRGYRIELGEIEATLRLHPQVREAAVTVQHAPGGDQRLVAYLVAEQPSPAQEELRAFLARHLPDYMLPSLVVQLSHLPLSPSGKLDRQALPAPDWSSLALSAGSTPARSPLEEVLVAIWQEVLGLPQVGIHDNFFLLGGHSLLATQVASRLHEVFHAEVPLRTLFEAPTISDLAQRLDGDALWQPSEFQAPSATPGPPGYPASLFRPTAALVPQPDRTHHTCLQYARCYPLARFLAGRGTGTGARRDRAPP